MSVPNLSPDELAEQIRLRALVDSLQQATASFWERRADAIESAAPRPGDFHGRATRAEVEARAIHCKEAAELCRAHARLLRGVAA